MKKIKTLIKTIFKEIQEKVICKNPLTCQSCIVHARIKRRNSFLSYQK